MNNNVEEAVDFVVHLGGSFNELKQRMLYIHNAITTDPELLAVVKELSAQLIGISQAEDDMSEHRKSFLTDDPNIKRDIRQVGVDLNELGGLSMMQYVHYRIRPLLKHPSDGRCLEFAWDGIGEWSC